MARSDSKEDLILNNLENIKTWIVKGLTEKEIAKKVGMAYSTFRRHKKDMQALKDAIKEGLEEKQQEVEKALFKKCLGFHYTEEVVQKVKKERIEDNTVLVDEVLEVKEVKKYSPPDLNAQKYYLNNRDKVHWSDDPNRVANDKKLTKLKEKELNDKSKLINELGVD